MLFLDIRADRQIDKETNKQRKTKTHRHANGSTSYSYWWRSHYRVLRWLW